MGTATVDDGVGEIDEKLGQAPLSRGIVAEHRGEGGVAQGLGQALAEGLTGAGIVTEAQEAAHNMLQQPGRLLLDQLRHHVAEDSANSVEPFVRGADVVKPAVIKQYLLNDEDSDSLAKLGTRLHDAQTKRDDLGGQQEVDDLGGIVLNQGTNDAKRGEAQVLEGARFGGGVQKGVQVQRDMGWVAGLAVDTRISRYARGRVAQTLQEQGARLVMTSNALKQGECITNAVRGGGRELRGVEEGVYRDDLLGQRGHDAERVPQNKGQLGHLLAFLTELQQGGLARALVEQVGDVVQGAAVVLRYVVEARVLDVHGRVLVRGGDIEMGTGHAAIVALLGGGGGGGNSGLLLGLVLLVTGLLVHPLLAVGVVLVMAVHAGVR